MQDTLDPTPPEGTAATPRPPRFLLRMPVLLGAGIFFLVSEVTEQYTVWWWAALLVGLGLTAGSRMMGTKGRKALAQLLVGLAEFIIAYALVVFAYLIGNALLVLLSGWLGNG